MRVVFLKIVLALFCDENLQSHNLDKNCRKLYDRKYLMENVE